MIFWIWENKSKFKLNDFFSLQRDYNKRFSFYEFISKHNDLSNREISYLEFGVASGSSFEWWSKQNTNDNSLFYGFDTFEGLPESWGGFYEKGAMAHSIPTINDKRATFFKGLFQDTVNTFLDEYKEKFSNADIRIVHLDADLYTSTIFVLSQLFHHLKDGDIIMFDEFNVPLHEFKAFYEFRKFSYFSFEPLAAVNNYYQAAFYLRKNKS